MVMVRNDSSFHRLWRHISNSPDIIKAGLTAAEPAFTKSEFCETVVTFQERETFSDEVETSCR